jgi:hypothetical protein
MGTGAARSVVTLMIGRVDTKLVDCTVIRLAYELCLQMEAHKHRDQPELLEVQLLTALEKDHWHACQEIA